MDSSFARDSMTRIGRYDGRDIRTQQHTAVVRECMVKNLLATLQHMRVIWQRYPAAQFDFKETKETNNMEIAYWNKRQTINGWISWGNRGDRPSRQGRLETNKTSQIRLWKPLNSWVHRCVHRATCAIYSDEDHLNENWTVKEKSNGMTKL